MKTSSSDLVVIVPYRDRPEHLRRFVPHMEDFLENLPFKILLVEQVDAGGFNRGKLLNIGYVTAREEARWICLHDIDMLPLDRFCDYSFSPVTTHLAGRAEQFGYRMPYPEFFGGVLVTLPADFEKANGCSNGYRGGRNEDDDLYLRYRLAGIAIKRKPGRYRSLPHKQQEKVEASDRLLARALQSAARHFMGGDLADRIRKIQSGYHFQGLDHETPYDYLDDGLSSLQWELVSRKPLSGLATFSVPIASHHEVISVRI